MDIRNPYFPAIANTWQAGQVFNGGFGLPGTQSNNFPGFHWTKAGPNSFNPGNNLGGYLDSNYNIIFNVANDSYLGVQSEGGTVVGISSVPSTLSPTIASGTVYQNTTYGYQTLTLPFYASTAGTAGTVTINMGTSSTPGAWTTVYVSGGTSSTATTNFVLRVPPQWYYEVVVSGATIGTVNGVQE